MLSLKKCNNKNFLGEVPSLVPLSSSVSSVNTFYFLAGIFTSCCFQPIDQIVYFLSACDWFSFKLVLKFSTPFSSRLIFETEFC